MSVCHFSTKNLNAHKLWKRSNFVYNMKNSPELTLCMGLVCDNFGVVKLLYWNYKQSMTGNNESPPRVKIVFDNLFLTNCYDFLNLETLHVASYTVGEFYISPD